MNTKLSKEDAFTVADSTDWLPTPLSSLSAVDSALRCQVCKDFYNTPMITSCSHTFCSVCIRRCLSSEGKCPACRTNDQELKLRFNGAMEDIVQAFIRARDRVLEFARTPKEVLLVEKREGKRTREQERDDIREDEPRKRTRASTRQTSSQRVVVIDSEDDGDEFLPEGFVHCPICNKEVKEDTINAHIDRNCEDEPASKGRKTSFQPAPKLFPQKPVKALERLPQINYSMMKDGPLRKKLSDTGLSAAGTRQFMIQRYSEWITLWNANCDATNPKTKGELKREMDIWERTQGKTTSSHIGPQIRDKDFDGAAWSTKHDGDFKNLIANARKKIAKPSRSEESTNAEEGRLLNSSKPDLKSEGTIPYSEEHDAEVITGHESDECLNLKLQASVPARDSSSQGGRFEEGDRPDEHDAHPSTSQYQNNIPAEKDPGFTSDIATSTPIQS